MKGFSFDTTLTQDDWDAYVRAANERSSGTASHRRANIVFVVPVIAAAATFLMIKAFGPTFAVRDFATGMVLCYLLLLLRAYLVRRRMRPDIGGTVLGTRTIMIGPEGMTIRRADSESLTRWSALQDVTVTSTHVFLWIDRIAALTLPIRDLPNGLSANGAVATIRELAGTAGAPPSEARAGGSSAPVLIPAGPTTRSDAGPAPSFRASLEAAGRLYVFRLKSLPQPFVASEWAIAALTLAALALWIAFDRWSQRGPAEFWPGGVGGISWHLLVALLIASVLRARISPRPSYVTTLWVVAAISPIVVAGLWIAGRYLGWRWSWLADIATLAVATLYASRAVRVLAGTTQSRAVASAFLTAVVAFWVGKNLFISSSMWMPSDTESAGPSWGDGERLLFDQPARIDAAVDKLKATAGATPGVYMVGFAGVGGQRVFAEEIALAARVIGNRYGTSDRTVLLVNDRRDVASHPLASVSGLERTLREVGERMDRDRDILFLVLSSHGSDEPAISVSNGSLPLSQLTGTALAAALRESGIRWKVIIISACHAGAFIPPLQDDGTIILTAAAPDRTSFGCSDDRDLTYFGEAFFRDALPTAPTLKTAFDQAAKSLAAREQAEHITSSNPQASFGSAITARIDALDRAREPRTASVGRP